MKVFLMHRDTDFDLQALLPPNHEDLMQDLELTSVLDVMANGDPFLFGVAKTAILSGLTDPTAILYRQHVLADCLDHPSLVREIYEIATEAVKGQRKIWGWGMSSPDGVLNRSVLALEFFVTVLQQLRTIADEHASEFRSEGFRRVFATLGAELDDDYFQAIEYHLTELKFHRGVLTSAELGKGNKGVRHVLRRTPEQHWTERIFTRDRSGYSFQLHPRDESGFSALSELRGKGINLVANALAQSTVHILSFFTLLQAELAFYVGCLNLQARLTEKGEPTCFPVPRSQGDVTLSARGLYDVCLTLHLQERVIGNDVNGENRSLIMITGANQGGKSTFLRSVGLAQSMMQSGMFVGAEAFSADIREGVFTHYKREEDPTMKSGKLDEELGRMSVIADQIGSKALMLCNESFASTNEREGSEIARQVVRALVEAGVKIVFVTHLYDLASGLYGQDLETALFLRAERRTDGRRTFRLVEGEPEPTSYGTDSYKHIFGVAPEVSPPAVADTTP